MPLVPQETAEGPQRPPHVKPTSLVLREEGPQAGSLQGRGLQGQRANLRQTLSQCYPISCVTPSGRALLAPGHRQGPSHEADKVGGCVGGWRQSPRSVLGVWIAIIWLPPIGKGVSHSNGICRDSCHPRPRSNWAELKGWESHVGAGLQ